MRAITLWQPWASLIADGRKPFETRSWPAPQRMMGMRFAIHAGRRVEREVLRDLGYPEGVPTGSVLAYATLAACGRVAKWGKPGDRIVLDAVFGEWPAGATIDAMGDYSPGRWAWFFNDVIKLALPIPARGRQGIWEFRPPPRAT